MGLSLPVVENKKSYFFYWEYLGHIAYEMTHSSVTTLREQGQDELRSNSIEIYDVN